MAKVLHYVCDYEKCAETKPSGEMIYVRVPPSVDSVIRVRRFCCPNHFLLWVREKFPNSSSRTQP